MKERQNTRGRRRRRQRRPGGSLLMAGFLSMGILLAALLSCPAENLGAAPQPAQPTDGFVEKTSPSSRALPLLPTAKDPEPDREEDWRLCLVNPWNLLPENYSIQTVELSNGLCVDERCYPDLQAMMDACRADGLSPVICSAYRTWAYQERLFKAKVEQYLSKGFSQDAAEVEAGKVVAVPGTSEHQLGLAVDIVDINNQNLDESQEDTAVQKWLMAHSWEYGFILRYPNEKNEITGIIYEPWHYRYVGREHAELIFEQGVCLEEYLESTF